MFYWLSKLHKRPYKARIIANSSPCITTELSEVYILVLLLINNNNNNKKRVVKYLETIYEGSCKQFFWSMQNSDAVSNKLTNHYENTPIQLY